MKVNKGEDNFSVSLAGYCDKWLQWSKRMPLFCVNRSRTETLCKNYWIRIVN